MKPNTIDVIPIFKPTKLTFTKDRITGKKPSGNRCSTWGIMHLLLYYQILKDIEDGKLSPTQEVRFSIEAAREYGALRSTKGQVGEIRLLKDVLNQAVSLNAPDCIVALFEVYGGREKTRKKLNSLADKLLVSVNAKISPTGRKKGIQLTNLYDYYKLGQVFLALDQSTLNYLRNKEHVIHGISYSPQASLADQPFFSSLFWGTKQNECMIFTSEGNELVCTVVINGTNNRETVRLALTDSKEEPSTSLLEVEKQINYKDWLTQSFEGYFLNDDIIGELTIDHVSMDESCISMGEWKNVAYIALAQPNYHSLVPRTGRQVHANKKIKKSPLIANISLIITDEPISELRDRIPQFIVPNSLKFAYLYASYVSEAYKGKFVTITGSAGKSSTRLMLSHLMKEEGKIFENYGNANLHYPTFGLSLEMNHTYDFTFFEGAASAMNLLAYGNNAYLWRSDVAIITSIGSAHALTGIERNMRTKKQILFGVKEGGYAIINGDIEEQYLLSILRTAKELNVNVLLYSLFNKNADCYLTKKNVQKDQTEVTICLMGKEIQFALRIDSDGQIQNAMGVLLAIECMGYAAENFANKLKNFQSFERILTPIELELDHKKIALVDDTHNSSIEATMNGIQYFASKKNFYTGKSILVLGEIADLGNQKNEQHKRLEPYINASSADKIIFYGEPFKYLDITNKSVIQCETKEQVVQEIKEAVTNDSYVFVKGSYGIGFYEVVDQLKKEADLVNKGE